MKKLLATTVLAGTLLSSSLMAATSGTSSVVITGTINEATSLWYSGQVDPDIASGISVGTLNEDFGTIDGDGVENGMLYTTGMFITTNHSKSLSVSSNNVNFTHTDGTTTFPMVLKFHDGVSDTSIVNTPTQIWAGGIINNTQVGTLNIYGGSTGGVAVPAGSISGTATLTLTVN